MTTQDKFVRGRVSEDGKVFTDEQHQVLQLYSSGYQTNEKPLDISGFAGMFVKAYYDIRQGKSLYAVKVIPDGSKP